LLPGSACRTTGGYRRQSIRNIKLRTSGQRDRYRMGMYNRVLSMTSGLHDRPGLSRLCLSRLLFDFDQLEFRMTRHLIGAAFAQVEAVALTQQMQLHVVHRKGMVC
jgi:hypothetical protein